MAMLGIMAFSCAGCASENSQKQIDELNAKLNAQTERIAELESTISGLETEKSAQAEKIAEQESANKAQSDKIAELETENNILSADSEKWKNYLFSGFGVHAGYQRLIETVNIQRTTASPSPAVQVAYRGEETSYSSNDIRLFVNYSRGELGNRSPFKNSSGNYAEGIANMTMQVMLVHSSAIDTYSCKIVNNDLVYVVEEIDDDVFFSEEYGESYVYMKPDSWPYSAYFFIEFKQGKEVVIPYDLFVGESGDSGVIYVGMTAYATYTDGSKQTENKPYYHYMQALYYQKGWGDVVLSSIPFSS